MKHGKLTPREEAAKAKARLVADKYFETDGEPIGLGQDLRAPGLAGVVPPKKLTAKEGMFIEEYLVDMNATQAAIRAGYSAKTAAAIGYENLRKPHIARAITQAIKDRASRTKWDADRVLHRLGEELNADIADLFDDDGKTKPPNEWPLIFRTGLVAGIEAEEMYEGHGDEREHVGTRFKIKMSDRIKRIDLIGKHIAVQAFKERKEFEVAEGSPLALLAAQLVGTSIQPTQPVPTIPVDPDDDETDPDE